jgi:DNA-directed RNA polymerase specialized sigma24 family protein
MALAHAIAEHLPYLRRYARALCGTQKSGDAYVRACLETIVADPMVIGSDTTPRVALYRLFHQLWASANLDLRSTAGSRPQTAGVEKKLGELTPARRQALLLTAMEGFNVSDTARILEVGEEDVKQMVAQAVREISDQPSTKVLIIEDEPIISLDLQSIVREMGHTVAAIATTRDEAVRAARKTEPGLVLADIKLADGSSGIDAVRQILSEV